MLLSLPAHLLFHSLLQVLIRGPQEGEFVSPPKVIHLLGITKPSLASVLLSMFLSTRRPIAWTSSQMPGNNRITSCSRAR